MRLLANGLQLLGLVAVVTAVVLWEPLLGLAAAGAALFGFGFLIEQPKKPSGDT